MKKVLIVIAVLTSFGLSAQNSMTLEQCIQTALKNNLDVQRVTLTNDLAEQDLISAKGQHLPTINLFLQSDLNFGRTIDPFTNTFATDEVRSDAYGLSGRWDLFTGGARYNSYKQAQLNILSSQYDADKMKNDISLSVTLSYLDILFNQELLKVAKEQQRLSEKQVSRIKKMVDAGSAPMGNLLDLEAQMAQEELNVVNVQNNLDLANLKLQLLMRLDSVENFSIVSPDVDVSAVEKDQPTSSFIYYKALETMPEIKSAEIKYQAISRGLMVEKARMSPTISLRGSLGSGFSGKNIDPVTRETKQWGNQVSDNFNQSIGVSLTFPILNSLNTHTSVSRAKVNLELQKNELERTKYNVNQTVKKAYVDAMAAKKKYDANTKALVAMKESFKYAQKRYDVGIMNGVEYNQVKTNFTKAEAELLQAKYDYLFKFKVLEFYQGKPISLN